MPSDQNDQWVAAASSALTLRPHAVHRTAVGSGGARSSLRFWGKIVVIPLACSIAPRPAMESGRRVPLVSRPSGCPSLFLRRLGSVAFKSLVAGKGLAAVSCRLERAVRPCRPKERRLLESPQTQAAQHFGCQLEQLVLGMRRRSKVPAGGVHGEARGQKRRPGFGARRPDGQVVLAGSEPAWPEAHRWRAVRSLTPHDDAHDWGAAIVCRPPVRVAQDLVGSGHIPELLGC